MIKAIDNFNVKTGDLFLCSGSGPVSRAIRIFSRSRWSHVGMFVVPEDVGIKTESKLLILESTTLSDVVDIISGSGFQGVQICDAGSRIFSYCGVTAIRKKRHRLSPLENEGLKAVIREHHGKPYEKENRDLLAALIPAFQDDEKDLSSIFCSELIAEIMKSWGMMNRYLFSDGIAPGYFGEQDLLGYEDDILLFVE